MGSHHSSEMSQIHTTFDIMTGQPTPPLKVPLPRNKALLRAYYSLVSLNKALLNPYFWGGTLGGLVDWPVLYFFVRKNHPDLFSCCSG